MPNLLRASLVALLGFAVATPTALAGKAPVATPEKGQMTVKDEAHVFDKDSVIRAESKFHGITFKSPTHFTVMTVDKVPADKKADFDKAKDGAARHALMRDWVREIAPVESDRGVFVLICQEVRLLEVVADRQTDLKRHFGDTDAKHVADILTAGMKASSEGTKTEDEKRAVRGEALVRATDYVIGQLKNTSAPEATGTTHTDGGHGTTKAGMPWWGWVLIVLGVLLFIWVIVALIRAMTGNVYGGMYAGGGYGYYGGGPGFFGCFMGGMFGAMAGMWMYNSMMGTHYAHDPSMASAGEYGDTGGADTGAGDYDNGAEAGGDWGDSGGGDAGGGGGGDWGADDAGGGGGDWGNDGGGGDWGGDGGGGGDFGGGGGDW